MLLFAARPKGDEASGMNTETMHSEFFQRLFFSTFLALASAILALGGMLTQAETRWICICGASSILASGFVSLSVKRPDEKMKKVVGRCGLALMGGVLGTHPVAKWFNVEGVETNAITLAFISSLVCILTYFIGHALILLLNSRSEEIADDILVIAFRWIRGQRGDKPKKEDQ